MDVTNRVIRHRRADRHSAAHHGDLRLRCPDVAVRGHTCMGDFGDDHRGSPQLTRVQVIKELLQSQVVHILVLKNIWDILQLLLVQ